MNDATLEAICVRADRLSVFASAFRYPGNLEEPALTPSRARCGEGLRMKPPTKAVKRRLRELAALAHEADLSRALLPVSVAFDEWKAGKLGSGELAHVIHEFHDGPARELFKLYNGNHEWAVGYAIANGILSAEAVPVDVLEHCQGAIELIKEGKGE